MKKSILYLLSCLLLASFVFAIPSNGITLYTPTNGDYTNLNNYTSGFNFSWNDPEYNYNASCTLWMGTDNNYGIIKTNGNYSMNTAQVNHNTPTVFMLNKSIVANNSANYWFVQCTNSSYNPTTAVSSLYVLYQDQQTPIYNLSGYGFTNNTAQTTTSMRFLMNVTDNAPSSGTINVSLMNGSSGDVIQTLTINNATTTNLTFTLPEDNFTGLYLDIVDRAGNTNTTVEAYDLSVDATAPTLSWITPTADSIIQDLTSLFNFTITEKHIHSVILEWNGTNETIGNNNCTKVGDTFECGYNKTVVDGFNLSYKLHINDTAGNELITQSYRYLSIDNTGIALSVSNATISSSNLIYNIAITDTSYGTCQALIYNSSYELQTRTTETINAKNTTINCTGTISRSDLGIEGAVTLNFNVTDGIGNENQTINLSAIYNELYVGWNLVTHSDSNNSIQNLCNQILNCTSIAKFNNTDRNYTTYASSTPGTNNLTQILSGDAIMVYVTQNSTALLQNNNLPGENDAAANITLSTGWNQVGLLRDANVSAWLNATSAETGELNITYISKYNPDSQKFYTCSQSTGLCAGTSDSPTDIPLVRGEAIFALTDEAANYTLTRYGVTG